MHVLEYPLFEGKQSVVMATTSRSILVSNLPNIEEIKLIDKLEIHFSKRANGGGDVDQIVITEQCGQIGTFAVIIFTEKESK